MARYDDRVCPSHFAFRGHKLGLERKSVGALGSHHNESCVPRTCETRDTLKAKLQQFLLRQRLRLGDSRDLLKVASRHEFEGTSDLRARVYHHMLAPDPCPDVCLIHMTRDLRRDEDPYLEG